MAREQSRRLARASLAVLLIATSLAFSQNTYAQSASDEQLATIEKARYVQSINQKGEHYARLLTHLFVFLHRQGVDISTDSWVKADGPRATLLIASRLPFDGELRASMTAWLSLLSKTARADFSSHRESEFQVLSRDGFSLALLNSENFWQTVAEISRREGVDLRPRVQREIRGMQFTGNAVSILSVGALGAGVASGIAKIFGITRGVSLTLAAGSTSAVAAGTALTAKGLWDNERQEKFSSGSLLTATKQEAVRSDAIQSQTRELQQRAAVLKLGEKLLMVQQGRLESPHQGDELKIEISQIAKGLAAFAARLRSGQSAIDDDNLEHRQLVITTIDDLLKWSQRP